MSIILYNKHHISAIIKGERLDDWRFTGSYGNPNQTKRPQSWELLRRIKPMCSLPWLIGGDFNEIFYNQEKLGSNIKNPNALKEFNQILSHCGLKDMGFEGYKHTWCNNRSGHHRVEETLDRAYCNSQWNSMFNFSRVQNLSTSGSNNSPVVL